jgi:serine/threonine-protein kinase
VHSTEQLATALAGRYHIERTLGVGGMATVYLAKDLKHDRKVAIKVLKPELAAVLGADRFVVEIKTTAALQHPHILPLFDSGEADGFLYYVMPYIEGETIREKLNRETQFGVDEAVRIAREVADALDYAHRHGVIHRDIKPENILLHDGRAMVMDFGIALAVSAAAGGRMTETGLSLGTPHYMSPEQATAEKEITPRSDVYSLASVLYEMLAGEPPHTGGSAQAVIMKIITEQAAPVNARRRSVPPNVVATLARALEKVPADRFENAKAFADALANPSYAAGALGTGAAERGAQPVPAPPARGVAIKDVVAWSVATAFAVVALWAWGRGDSTEVPTTRLVLELPSGHPDMLRFAVSRDGSHFAFTTDEGIVVRDAGTQEYRVLPGSSNGESPTFSPDGEWVAFNVRGHLRKASVRGGSAVPIIGGDSVLSGTLEWGPTGDLVFEARGGLYLLPAGGSAPHRLRRAVIGVSPRFTPDGRGVLYAEVQRGARLMYYDLSKDTAFAVLEEAAAGQLLPDGLLLYSQPSGGIFAVRFDQSRHAATGTPQPVISDMIPNAGIAPFAVTANGTLVYRAGLEPMTRLVIRDPAGRMDTLPVAPQHYAFARYSPDGHKLAFTVGLTRTTGRYTSIYGLETGSITQFTTEGGGHSPVWSPDGKYLAFTAEGSDTDAEDLFVQPVDRSAQPVRVAKLPNDQHATAWPRDSMLVFTSQAAPNSLGSRSLSGIGRDTLPNVSILNPFAPGVTRPYLRAAWSQQQVVVSPDAHWAAYASSESGTQEIVIQGFPNVAERGIWKASSGGGQLPHWSSDGRTIYYLTLDGKELKAVKVATGSDVTVGAPQTAVLLPKAAVTWDLDAVTGKMVFAEPAGGEEARIVVVQHWLAEFKRTRR